jgi:type 1 glutamine amidotransferase
MAAIQKFMQNGGAWIGVHSATDFEKTDLWPWYEDQLAGAWFDHHDADGTPGSVVWEADAISADHPTIRGIKSPWSCSDEWYCMNRDPSDVPGFAVLGRLKSDQRPVSWIHELPGGGRAFYTIRGHNRTVYAEPDFTNHIHQAILWAVHRLK